MADGIFGEGKRKQTSTKRDGGRKGPSKSRKRRETRHATFGLTLPARKRRKREDRLIQRWRYTASTFVFHDRWETVTWEYLSFFWRTKLKIFVYKRIVIIGNNWRRKGWQSMLSRSFGLGTLGARESRVGLWHERARVKVFSDKPDAPRSLLFNSGRCALRVFFPEGFWTSFEIRFPKKSAIREKIRNSLNDALISEERF